MSRTPHPRNAPGDWYVADSCCVLCGVPEAAAPGLFGWALYPDGRAESCFVQRQPADAEESAMLVLAASISELRCIRYRGTDPATRAALEEQGASAQIDDPERA